MAKIKGLSKIKLNIERTYKQVRIDADTRKLICEIIEEDTKQTIREGKNPNTPNSARIRKIKKTTADRRRALARNNNTHTHFSPSRSNLTFTGELIDSLRCTMKQAGNHIVITLGAHGKHKRYTGVNGKKFGKQIDNQKIFEYQKEMLRDVIGIRGPAKKQVIKLIKELYKDIF